MREARSRPGFERSIISRCQMDCKKGDLIAKLRRALGKYPFWNRLLSPKNAKTFTLHLAILREPYLSFIMEGKKTIETRFAKRACPPYQSVSNGDVVVLKRAAGEIVGVCTVEQVWYYRLNPGSLDSIRERFGTAICPANGTFWEERKQASVATLMMVGNVAEVEEVEVKKRDRRGWVVFKNSGQIGLFNSES